MKSPSMNVKETRSVTMNIFRKKYFLFKSLVKVELSYIFKTIWSVQLETARKSSYLIKRGFFFLLLVIIYVPPIILDS